MQGIDLLLAKLDSALGNTGTDINAAVWKTPTGSPIAPQARKAAREAAREGEKLGALSILLTAAAEAGAQVPAALLDEAEAHVTAADAAPSSQDLADLTEAIAVLRAPAPAPKQKKGLLGFLRR